MASKIRASLDGQQSFDQYLKFSGSQSAANAFLEVTIPTNITPDNELVIVIKEVQIEFTTGMAASSFNAAVDASLSRLSRASVASLLQDDIIAKFKYTSVGQGAITAGGSGILETPTNMVYSGKQIIVAPNVYLQLATSGMVSAQTIVGRIYYETQRMSKADILEILYG